MDPRNIFLRSRFVHDADEAQRAPILDATVVTEADLAPLPSPVQTFLRRAGVVGRPHTRGFVMQYHGQLRSKPEGPWMAVQGSQTSRFDGEASSRLFFVDAAMFGVPFHAYHRYVGRDATMDVRVLSLLPVVSAHGPEMNQSETVTILNDMCSLAPSALLDPNVRFEAEDERHARVFYTRLGITVSAELTFDELGDIACFVSEDRYLSSDGKTFTRLPWVTPLRDHVVMHGFRIPRHGEAIWKRPEGDLEYARFEIIDVEPLGPADDAGGPARPGIV